MRTKIIKIKAKNNEIVKKKKNKKQIKSTNPNPGLKKKQSKSQFNKGRKRCCKKEAQI